MIANHEGLHWELAAESHLSEQGLKPLHRNFHCRLGEIDLIMQDADTLVFVEVRYRSNARFGSGVESVTKTKQLKICRAAGIFLSRRPALAANPCRFDVVGISGNPEQPVFTWVPNAFNAGA